MPGRRRCARTAWPWPTEVTWEDVRRLVLALPGVVEGTGYGVPAFRVGGKVFANQPPNRKVADEGRVLALHDVPLDERDELIRNEPEVFFFTDHYRDYPMVLVRLPKITPDRLRPYLERSWRARAPKRLLREVSGG